MFPAWCLAPNRSSKNLSPKDKTLTYFHWLNQFLEVQRRLTYAVQNQVQGVRRTDSYLLIYTNSLWLIKKSPSLKCIQMQTCLVCVDYWAFLYSSKCYWKRSYDTTYCQIWVDDIVSLNYKPSKSWVPFQTWNQHFYREWTESESRHSRTPLLGL